MSSGTQRKPKDEILKAMCRKRAKTEHLEIVLNGPRMASVREEVRAASKNDGKRQRRSRLACEARRHSKGDGKGDAKGKGPKRSQFVRRVKQFGVHPFSEEAMPKGIRMRSSASTRMLTLRIPKWMQMRGYVCIQGHRQSP